MAMQVVDRLEIIQIDHEHRAFPAAMRHHAQHLVQFVVQHPAVRQTGQRIVSRQFHRTRFGGFVPLDFAPCVDRAAHREDQPAKAEQHQKNEDLVEFPRFVPVHQDREFVEGVGAREDQERRNADRDSSDRFIQSYDPEFAYKTIHGRSPVRSAPGNPSA